LTPGDEKAEPCAPMADRVAVGMKSIEEEGQYAGRMDLTGSKHQKDPTYMLLIVRLLVVSAAGSVAIFERDWRNTGCGTWEQELRSRSMACELFNGLPS